MGFECGAIVAGVEFAAGVACTVESVGRSAEQRPRTTSAGVLAKMKYGFMKGTVLPGLLQARKFIR